MARLCLTLAILAMAFPQGGCASRKRMTRAPEALPPELVSADDVIGRLLENYGGLTSLRVSGRIEAAPPGEERRRRASLVALIRKPDKVRMRAYRPLAPPLFEYVSDGDECWLYTPSRRAAYLSEECRPFRVDGDYMAVSAEAVIAALCVLVDPEALSTASVRPEKGSWRVELPAGSGAEKTIWVDSATGLATRQWLIGDDGLVEVDISYLEHEIEAGAAVPISVEIASPRMGAAATLRIKRFEIDARTPDDAFEFSPPAGVDVFHIDDTFSSGVSR
jgi:outer membrane lipoprotein-sorting protein